MAKSRRTSAFARRRSAVIRRDRLGMTWDDLEDRIKNDLCFDIHTADGKYWIDPFTGKRAAAAKRDRVAALKHYFETYTHWQKYPVKSLQELTFWRWVHYLGDHLRSEQRLRFFRQDGHWLNPFTGTWHQEIRRVEGRITSMTLHEMAKVLAMSVTLGPAEPLPFQQLRLIIEETHQKAPAASQGVATQDLDGIAGEASNTGTDVVEASAVDANTNTPGEAPPVVPVAPEPVMPPAKGRRQAPGPETERAQKVQNNILGQLPAIPGYELAVAYESMDQVSGDFYDVQRIDQDRLLLVVGDVTGHGIQAALVMATVLKALRYIIRATDDLVEVVCRLNDDIKGDLLGDQFVTMWFGMLHCQEQRLVCLSAGHHPVAVCNTSQEAVLRRIGAKGAAIGMAAGSRIRATYKAVELQLKPGDVLVQYTDGLSEALDSEEREYGDLRVLGSALAHLEEGALQEMVDGVLRDVRTWCGGEAADDLTILALKVMG